VQGEKRRGGEKSGQVTLNNGEGGKLAEWSGGRETVE
jgi:hypothetical protein